MLTLLTDFGDSIYPAQMKGVIHSILPEANVVDLSHHVPFADIKQASYALLCSFRSFPVGTVHICVVDPGVGSRREVLILHLSGHTFVAPDNGLLGPLWERFAARVFHLREFDCFCLPQSLTFHGRDVFAPVGAWIAKGVPLITIAEPVDKPAVTLGLPEPQVQGNVLTGEVVFVDPFGNLITNIELTGLHKKVERVVLEDHTIEGLANSYLEWKDKGLGAIEDSCGFLEIFTYQGSARDLTGAGVGSKVQLFLS